jgi:DNA helicase-2/ATP-dependent DNA helicase PcrA
MRVIADFHIHSRFSRACSKDLTLPNLDAWARAKGIDVIASGDFTHPEWLKEIGSSLEPAEPGLFRLRPGLLAPGGAAAPIAKGAREPRFILTTEISCIYKKGDRTRRLHLIVFAPSIEAVRRIIASLEARKANLRADGRPIIGMDAKTLLQIALDADPDCMVVPAHAWTPWFAVFGSQSGFDSLEECFEELAPHITAIETGLSSDPAMNRRVSALDRIVLISNSDAHGPRNLGREANVFDVAELSYAAIAKILRGDDRAGFLYTIEFHPEEGKYHIDGHRECKFSCQPEETARRDGICPVCGKPLTRGVVGRVHALADRSADALPQGHTPYKNIVPLEEIIAETLGKGRASKAVFQLYAQSISRLGPEFDLLLDTGERAIADAVSPELASAIMRVRRGELTVVPGFDGEYGKVKINERRHAQAAFDL